MTNKKTSCKNLVISIAYMIYLHGKCTVIHVICLFKCTVIHVICLFKCIECCTPCKHVSLMKKFGFLDLLHTFILHN